MARNEAMRMDEAVVVDREVARLADARAELEQASAALQAADPDDTKVFGALVSRREVARARNEALELRVENARGRLAQAQAVAEEAAQAGRAARLADLESRIAAADANITAEVVAFQGRLSSQIAALRELTVGADQLDPRPWAARARGSRWADVPTASALLVAASLFGATAAGAVRVLR